MRRRDRDDLGDGRAERGAYAKALRDGYHRILSLLAAQFPPGRQDEAATLFWLTQGLLGPVLIGYYTAEEALALLDAQLDRVFD